MLIWIWIVVVVVALIILGWSAGRLFGRLGDLRRAARGLQRRQAEALRLQDAVSGLQVRVAGLRRRAETVQERVAELGR